MVESDAITEFRREYHFLSNFYPCRISYDDIAYPSVEHAFQAAKTNNREVRAAIALAPTPGDAKNKGRRVSLRHDFETKKLEIMKELLLIKFSEPALKEKLLATGDILLIEGNTWGDDFWGMIINPGGMVGQNHLGDLLMQVRDELREVSVPTL